MYVGFYQGFPELLSFRSFSQIWVLLRFFEIAMIASFTVRFRVIEEKTWQSTEKTTTGNNWSQSWKPRMRSWNPSTSVRQYAAVTEFFGWHRMTRIAFAFRIPSCFCVILCLVCLIWINLVGHVMNVVALVPRVPFFKVDHWCSPGFDVFRIRSLTSKVYLDGHKMSKISGPKRLIHTDAADSERDPGMLERWSELQVSQLRLWNCHGYIGHEYHLRWSWMPVHEMKSYY